VHLGSSNNPEHAQDKEGEGAPVNEQTGVLVLEDGEQGSEDGGRQVAYVAALEKEEPEEDEDLLRRAYAGQAVVE